MTSRWCLGLLLAALLLVSGARAEDGDVKAEEEGAEYFYDEEGEEAASTHVPVFTSKSQELTVKEGDNVTLPCLVDMLGGAVLVWKTSTDTFFTSTVKVTTDERFSLEAAGDQGSSMVITGVTGSDAKTYECQIPSNPPVSLQHTVIVQSPPMVTVTPKEQVLVVAEGQQVHLACDATGSPQPTVTWTKKGGLLPYGEKKHTGARLDIASVESGHLGVYVCTAENGVGEPQVRHIRLEVEFAPQINVTSEMVHTGPGREARIECTVHGQPMPTVEWFRVQDTPLDAAHFERYEEGHRYGLKIASVREGDLGVYSCQAANKLGKQTSMVHLTGKPESVMVTSEPNGIEKSTYTIAFSVESYSPLLEYKVLYKQVKEEGAEEAADWQEEVASYQGDAAGDSSATYTVRQQLSELQPASVYQALVTARNQYGWTQPGEQSFRFSTLGAKALVAESRTPNSAVAARAGIVCFLAALLSLVALL